MTGKTQSVFGKWQLVDVPAATIVVLSSLLAYATVTSADESPQTGKDLVSERSKGNCLACHIVEDGVLPGSLGPPLIEMKLRFPDREKLRRQIYNASEFNRHSRMPPFGLHRILTTDEIERIIDYLYTL